MSALEALGEQAELALRKSLAGNPPLEWRRRMELLLEKADSAPVTDGDLRLMRSLALTQISGSPRITVTDSRACQRSHGSSPNTLGSGSDGPFGEELSRFLHPASVGRPHQASMRGKEKLVLPASV